MRRSLGLRVEGFAEMNTHGVSPQTLAELSVKLIKIPIQVIFKFIYMQKHVLLYNYSRKSEF